MRVSCVWLALLGLFVFAEDAEVEVEGEEKEDEEEEEEEPKEVLIDGRTNPPQPARKKHR